MNCIDACASAFITLSAIQQLALRLLHNAPISPGLDTGLPTMGCVSFH